MIQETEGGSAVMQPQALKSLRSSTTPRATSRGWPSMVWRSGWRWSEGRGHTASSSTPAGRPRCSPTTPAPCMWTGAPRKGGGHQPRPQRPHGRAPGGREGVWPSGTGHPPSRCPPPETQDGAYPPDDRRAASLGPGGRDRVPAGHARTGAARRRRPDERRRSPGTTAFEGPEEFHTLRDGRLERDDMRMTWRCSSTSPTSAWWW